MSKKTRRVVGEPLIWEIVHWLTMTILRHRIVRGYALKSDRLVCIFWDPATNWTDEGDDWARKPVPYPDPIWRRRDVPHQN